MSSPTPALQPVRGEDLHRRWGGPRPWRRVLVYGLGLSGRSAARLLLASGLAVVAVDRRQAPELELGELAEADGFQLLPGGEEGALPKDLDAVVLSPGVPADRPLLAAARQGKLPVISEAELALAWIRGPVLAITGTNGKSTTTELAGAMLRAAGLEVEVCGNIGAPVTERVLAGAHRAFVVELSSFQLESMPTLRPRAAALLNLAPDHLDRYPDLAAYGAAKAQIFAHQEPGDWAVVNGDDPQVLALVHDLKARRRSFSRREAVQDGCRLEGEDVVEHSPGAEPRLLFSRDQLPLAGAHNLENAMAAALLARALDAQPEHLQAALGEFRGLPHRMQRVAEIAGVTYFDDSKGTNVAAAVKSLEGLPDGRVHLILGGRHKGDDLAPLARLAAVKAQRVYLIGEAAEEMSTALGSAVAQEHSGTLEAAVSSAARRARSGDVVLLSPACASFDQFTSFAHRGQRFQELVQKLEQDLEGGQHG
ncbi:MAG: UDP-N-acetylmuramoyl-L-alanine--D-glutamate ligase [Acidobacteriota bacterium]|nr:UDP-N-acetylmuramoyl-L-alanine--D-glutamate ligase [Acidobacteriota bacterium]